MPVPWIPENAPADAFPRAELAIDEPNGLLAAGGDLSPARLQSAYSNGIFPWYSDDQPILWWSPDPRCVFATGNVHCSRSLTRWSKKVLAEQQISITFDQNFANVMRGCAAARCIDGQALYPDGGTWITDDMLAAYIHCHELGLAHSVEIWRHKTDEGNVRELVGGLYGLAIGQVFFAESMFSRTTNASKLALLTLDRHLLHWGYKLIDAQLPSDHLASMGATEMSRSAYLTQIQSLVHSPVNPTWTFDPSLLP